MLMCNGPGFQQPAPPGFQKKRETAQPMKKNITLAIVLHPSKSNALFRQHIFQIPTFFPIVRSPFPFSMHVLRCP